MNLKSKIVGLLLVVCCLTQLVIPLMGVKAGENKSVEEVIDEIIEDDKETLSNLSPTLEKLYEKLIGLFKKVGTLSKDIKRVVDMYNALDEEKESYPEDLMNYMSEYQKLGPVSRKICNFITGFLNQKDRLIASVKHIVVTDLYSDKTIEVNIEGNVSSMSENEAIATVKDVKDGHKILIHTVSVGMTKVVVTNESNESETFRVFVKKPLLSTRFNLKKGNKANIPLSSNATEIKVSNKKIISVENLGDELVVTGAAKGTGYIYVGNSIDGKTIKYKIKVK